ncbi:hypothetical protein WMY93_012500 [Mugilogobius chulae]|uniref:Major facilitator superfamily (MFS) profile domain-containing protein n=1 Tax=Mugilogobius chulae TaxID=88201 RepID=A0AAW0PFU6_9GOBI
MLKISNHPLEPGPACTTSNSSRRLSVQPPAAELFSGVSAVPLTWLNRPDPLPNNAKCSEPSSDPGQCNLPHHSFGDGRIFSHGLPHNRPELTFTIHPALYQQQLVHSLRRGASISHLHHDLVPRCLHVCIGGLLGVAAARFMSSKLGRKKTILFSNCIAIAGGIVILTSKTFNSFEMVIAARVLHGISAGMSSISHLMYLGEMAPKKIRACDYNILHITSLGKLSGQFLDLGREDLWNVLLCVPACLSVVSILLLPIFPEAPRYLFIEKGDDQACKKALQSLWGPGDYKEEMEEMLVEQAAIEASRPKSPLQLLRSRTSSWALFTLFLICGCNQMSGMSMVSTFSYDILYKAGMPKDYIRYVTFSLGVVEINTSICCGFLIEHIGRRPLYWAGYGVMAVSWVLVSVTVYFQDSAYWVPYLTALFIVCVIVFFCGGPGGGINTLTTEIFVQSERMGAVVLVGMYRWVMYAFMGLIFPFIIAALGSYSYVMFACWCLLGSLYTFFILPETKGKSVLEISKEFQAISICRKKSSNTADKEIYETVF